MAKLEEYGLTVDDFNRHDSLMVAQNVVEPESIVDEYPDIPGFTQSDKMSDDEVLRVFQARDELQYKKDEIGEPPADADWYKAGLTAEQRISKLRPFYETKKEEEWEQLEHPVDILAPLMGPIGAVTELVAGATDWRYDFGEKLHERGFGTSWNPLTGFGAWDIAEFKTNPQTGTSGFSPELLAMENELENLYGQTREYHEQYREGGYGEIGGIDQEIQSLNQLINESQLLDPRLIGER